MSEHPTDYQVRLEAAVDQAINGAFEQGELHLPRAREALKKLLVKATREAFINGLKRGSVKGRARR